MDTHCDCIGRISEDNAITCIEFCETVVPEIELESSSMRDEDVREDAISVVARWLDRKRRLAV